MFRNCRSIYGLRDRALHTTMSPFQKFIGLSLPGEGLEPVNQKLLNKIHDRMTTPDKKSKRYRESELKDSQELYEKKLTDGNFDEKLADLIKSFKKVDSIPYSSKLTTEEIRDYPGALKRSYFSDTAIENAIIDIDPQGKQIKPGERIKLFVDSKSDDTLFKTSNASNLRKVAQTKIQPAELEAAMKPHIEYLKSHISTDKDMLDQLSVYFKDYHERNKSLEEENKTVMAKIAKRSKNSPESLPQPYSITLPAIIKFVLTSPEFKFSTTRTYTLLSMIYHTCKNSKDITLYLRVCNIEFYNIFLKCTWENFHNIHSVRSLIDEMSADGVVGDTSTIKVLDKILENMRYMSDSMLYEETSNDLYSTGIRWCKKASTDVEVVEKYRDDLMHNKNTRITPIRK
ncbi:HBR164Wp [Eremothecium sinecaudum]|uniref:HBR164Wp n=1 Tax=Eremothecium sinecaudum TaxID=45286 RepID=A0A120K170_9SACH|nr:HBR164Wp [Eremothecium sinecaudum]AMD19065.1 HBR164Wp [Eremothecium sinecaudum]